MLRDDANLAPIAITGIGCRFPGGANGPAAFWKLLCDGVDAISEVPADRWNTEAFYDSTPGRRGKSNARWGGFVDGIDLFDAGFFGISPREAALVDPQQRLLLRAAWEALEDSGESLDLVRGSPAGVFVGISTTDYGYLQMAPADHDAIETWTATGGSSSIAANRISYCLNLQGPSVAVDTACSSSLVAVHFACRSLRSGECPVALAGGVNALLMPTAFISFSRAGMLSPDGRCKAFDASANGFVRAEGVGVVVLKPLAAALAAGDSIYAVIRGTSVNQDGRTNGITLPNPAAQERLVREACRMAGVAPSRVHYVEAHGTGTAVGDPIEAEALGAALGSGRDANQPCVIGSVKSAIGHLEAGAGIAGLIKVALSLHHGQIPPSLHIQHPNPHIDFSKLKLRLAQKLEPYPDGGEPPLAGVNSFGFGGTNAHAIVQAHDVAPRVAATTSAGTDTRVHLLVLSARSTDSLRALIEKYVAFLGPPSDGSGSSLRDICLTAGSRRTHLSHRFCAPAATKEQLADTLRAYLAGESRRGVLAGEPVGEPAPVFAFSGQGPQWWAMGRELMQHEPLFRQTIEECDGLFREFGDWSLTTELARDEGASRLHHTAIAQPAIFAVQVALAALWKSWGIVPAAAVGHSVGEVAAAHVAGILSLREAARVIFHRGRCMDLAPHTGRMLAAGIPWAQAEAIVSPYVDKVAVAAYNSEESVTFSGDAEAIEAIAAALEPRGVFVRRLQVNYAFHSQQMDPVRGELLRSLGRVTVEPATVPIWSTVSGVQAAATDFDAEYWWRNVRQPVRFAPAINALIQRGHRVFLELGPHPVLGGSILQCLSHRSARGTVLPSLRRNEPERETITGSLGALHVLGCTLNWSALEPDAAPARLPSYAWQEERYWHESQVWRDARLSPPAHPLLAHSLGTAAPAWQTRLDTESISYLKDHRVRHQMVFPGAGYVEMALGAARALWGSTASVIEDIDFRKALFLPDNDDAIALQFAYDPEEASFAISSGTGRAGHAWTIHAVGRMRTGSITAAPEPVALDSIRQACVDVVPGEAIYEQFRDAGLMFGPAFRGIEAVWRRDGEALARIRPPTAAAADSARYQVHPGLLDSCFQALSQALTAAVPGQRPALYLPVQIDRVQFFERPADEARNEARPDGAESVLWSHARLVHQGGRAIVGDIELLDEGGHVLLQITGFRCQAMAHARQIGSDAADECLYEFRWTLAAPRKERDASGVLAPQSHVVARTQALADRWRRSAAAQSDLGDLESALDQLCRRYLLAAFERLGWHWSNGEAISSDALDQRLGIAPQHRRLLARYLGLLERDGLLKRSASGLVVDDPSPSSDPEEMARAIVARYPGALPELMLVRQCGSGLAAALRGTADPAASLYADGSFSVIEHYYQDSYTVRRSNLLAAEAVAAAVGARSEGRAIRVLEIGAGTAGLTAHVLPQLPHDRTEYVFSDRSDQFFARAEQKNFAHRFVRCQLLDIENPPEPQGFDLRGFDLVLASEALAATADLRRALSHVRSLLAPHGLFVLQQTVRPTWLDEVVFGPTEDPWRFRDASLRPDHSLLDASQWLKLLTDVGFDGPCAVAEQRPKGSSPLSVFLAREPAAPPDSAPAGPPVEIRQSDSPGSWLIFADTSDLAATLATQLATSGRYPLLVSAGSAFRRIDDTRVEMRAGSPEDMQALLAEVRRDGCPRLEGIVHLWSLDAASDFETDTRSLTAAETLGCHSVVHLVQALAQHAATESPQLWLVTRGAQAVGRADEVVVGQAPLWGLGRVIINEQPKLRCRMVDLPPGAGVRDAADLIAELAATDGEEEVAIREGGRYVQRLARTSLDEHIPAATGDSRPGGRRLEVVAPGSLNGVGWISRAPRAPGPGEVEIDVHVAALNFRDVMKTLGIYPTEVDDDLLLGDECAGRIVAVGSGVDHLREGDDVIAMGAGCFSSHLTIPAGRAVRKPARLSDEEAATVPVAFLTAWYALHHLGQLRRGDRVLIQAAAGGVGMAAVQIARLAGAEIFATAGSVEKRAFLEMLGVDHVMDSRSLAFADDVRRFTQGRGVDLVLNSLAGEAIAKGIECLSPRGRFLEIGKRDIYLNSKLGLRPFRNNLSLSVIDLAQVMKDDPELVALLLTQVLDRLADGRLHPLPFRVFQGSQAATALLHMSQARHIGKIVLSLQEDAVAAAPVRGEGALTLNADASYLVTGGLGGFGLAVAGWLVKQGARHLALVGRTGASTEASRLALERLRSQGASVMALEADVSESQDVERVVATIGREMPPLCGVVHSAMVMDDSTLGQQTAERFHRVMAPKVAGAWNLHVQTSRLPLDFFVLFSSFSSMAGNSGQASYSAANSFLDALAHHRRAQGLPSLTVNWGVISDVGYISRHAELEAALLHDGLRGFRPDEATKMLGSLLLSNAVQVGVVRMNWQKRSAYVPALATSPRYAELRSASGTDVEATGESVRETILALPPHERLPVLTAQLKDQLAHVLRTSAARLDPQRPLSDLGLDSLMAVEMVNRVESHFSLVLPPGSIGAGMSIAKLADALMALLTGGPAPSAHEALPIAEAGPVTNAIATPDTTAIALGTPVPGTRAGAVESMAAPAPIATAERPSTTPPRPAAQDTPSPPARSGWVRGLLQVRFSIEWFALRALMAWFRKGDLPSARRRVRRIVPLARWLLRFNWRWALRNLDLVFGPNLSEYQRRRLASMAAEHHLTSYLEVLRQGDLHFEFHDHERLLEAHAAGRGVILCGVHLGSWEPGLRWGRTVGLPMAIVYRRALNPLSDRAFQDVRSSYQVDWIASDNVNAMMDALRAGKVLGLMTDLNTVSGGTVADFLGVPAACPSGPARLALLQGAPIVACVAIRTGVDTISVHILPPIVAPRPDHSDAQVRELTRRINAAFEPWILEYAEQYNWLHPRWRCRPDGTNWTLETALADLWRERTGPFPAVPERLKRVLGIVD